MYIPANLPAAIGKVCDPSVERYALGGILFERTADGPSACATDGRRLLAVSWQEPDSESDVHADGFSSILPPKELATVAKACERRSQLPERRMIRLDEPSANGTVQACACNKSAAITPLEGRFPKWRDIVPDYAAEPAAVSVHVNAKMLAELLLAMAQFTDTEKHRITLTVAPPLEGKTSSRPIVLAAEHEGVKQTAVIVTLSAK